MVFFHATFRSNKLYYFVDRVLITSNEVGYLRFFARKPKNTFKLKINMGNN
jgi:hypothetical protein